MDELVSVERPCPYCGEFIELLIDHSVPRQRYTEDCAVCCQPMVVTVVSHGSSADENDDDEPEVIVAREAD